MAPEYIRHGQFSIKSDVFSFGVIILEIVCGQRNTEIRDGENIEDLLGIVSVIPFNYYLIPYSKSSKSYIVIEISQLKYLTVNIVFIFNRKYSCRHGEIGKQGQLQIL